ASYPQCTPSIATSYYSTLNNVLSTCPRILSAIATGANTCMMADYANYNWAKRALTLSPNCAAALAPFGFTTTTLWYSIIQAATLTESNTLTSAVCGSADCVQLAKSSQSILTNCLTLSGENLFANIANLISYCASSPPPPFPPNSCDQQIQTANQMTLSQSCTSAIGSLTYSSSSPPTLAAIGMDYTKNPNSIYGYAICGIPACVASLTTFLASYPTCTPFPVSYWIGPTRTYIFPTSFLSTITTLNQNTCVNIASSIAGSNNTCQVADYATYKWAKFQVSLTPNCAAALSSFGYTSTSLWYSALQGATSTKLTTLAFCGSPDCIQLTTNMVSTLSNCSVASGENLFATATALVANCAVLRTLALAPPAIAVTTLTPSPNSTTFAPTATPVVRTCDQLMTTANQWILDDTCMSTFRGITATSTLAAIAIDFATNTNSIFGYSICGIPSCTSSLKRLLATYPRCTPVVATSYVGSLTSILNACPRLLNTVATTNNTCMLADYATYTWAKFQVTLTPNCAGDLSIYGYTGASSWYSVVQAAKLDLTNALTASFCGSSDCLALTNTTVAKLPNCKVASGDNLYSTTKSLLAFCPSTSNPYPDDSCDQLLTTANQRMLGPSCNRSTGLLLQPPSLAAVAIDYSNNPNSIFGFGICGDPACTASLTASLASYPTCSAFPAYYWSANSWAVVQPVSYASQLTTLLGSCAEYKVSIGTGNSTCQMADYAAYNWAKYQATLSSNCAASLARFGFNASSLWYAVVQTATLAPSNLLTSAFCGSVDCLQLTSAAASQLPNCSVASGENLFLTATNLLNYCNSTNPIPSPSPTSRPVPPAPYNATIQSLLGLSTNHTCDAIIRAANQWTLSQACGDSIFQGGTPPSLAAIGMDYSSNYYTVFGYGICGTPQCAASLRTHLTSYPSCTPIQATSYYSTLSTLLNSCPRLLNAITSGSNTCMLADYATTNWAKYQATLTPNCAAALAPFGYTT
ncbi:hypothetical protein As57867_016684, partial [Aphanomyces stellatus]